MADGTVTEFQTKTKEETYYVCDLCGREGEESDFLNRASFDGHVEMRKSTPMTSDDEGFEEPPKELDAEEKEDWMGDFEVKHVADDPIDLCGDCIYMLFEDDEHIEEEEAEEERVVEWNFSTAKFVPSVIASAAVCSTLGLDAGMIPFVPVLFALPLWAFAAVLPALIGLTFYFSTSPEVDYEKVDE